MVGVTMVGTGGKVCILASPKVLKVVSATFLLVCFLSLKESTCETRKKFLISLQKLFSFSRRSNFRFLDIYQMPHFTE